ncbi:MAG: protein translocase subunit SecD [Acidobacteriota bacterium]|jgi:preprotein translocase subunit SecD|nr:protein translocase subunit SecD [Bryobacteraceae bacterium CoA2 C42]
MDKNLKSKVIVIVATILICIYGIIGLPKSKAELERNIAESIKLGLDLRGGSQLVLQVQVQDAFKADADQNIERLKDEMQKAAIAYTSIDRNEPATIEEADTIQINIKGVPVDKTAALREIFTQKFSTWQMASVGSDAYRLTMNNTESLAMRRDTVTRSMRTIEQRINGLGLAEATVQQRGNGETNPEILVQMPGVDDPARVKSILQAAAMLEIVEVKDGPFPSEEALRAKNGGILPLGTRPIRQATRPGDQGESWYLVNRTAVVTGRDLRNARSSQDQFGKWETSFVLSPDAGRRFGRYTESNVGNKLAVLLDGRARSVAVINSKIEDSGVITGAGSQQEAADLALVLTSGSLPAGVVYLEERTVGPSLGADSIRDGLLAGAVGVGAVVLVMLVYYKRAGINAVLALVLNAIILIAVLAYLGAVLTLPGIAGIILTIGMAVDSNVLIFERIREELRHGKAVLAAIDAGFGKAWLTIVDTHVTTVVSCAFLFIFGTTAVKGFAITLVIGLLANVFTAVFVSRTIFDWELNGKPQSTTLSI